jgi:CO/xanthine dehydrogenase Mo-binding subunit
MHATDEHEDRRPGSGRRSFLKAGLGLAGAMIMAVHLPSTAQRSPRAGAAAFSPNAFIAIGADGSVTLVMPFVEMGQGTYTSIPMLIAEELEVDLARIRLEHAPADEKRFAHPLFGTQLTGGSGTIRGGWEPMRKAGAAARMMLVEAAAREWKVGADGCRAVKGEVVHLASGRKLGYGQLAAGAAALPLPKEIPLKPATDYALIGTPAKRLDVASKVNGAAKFGIDASVPGMKVAAVAACPVFGGTLASVDDSKARAIKGVRKIVRLDDAVAVVADHTGAARKGLAALAITWNDGPNAGFSTAAWERKLTEAVHGKGQLVVDEGSFAGLVAGGARTIDAVYSMPMLAHATMEPMNCTARVDKDGAELWLGTQAPVRVQSFVAKALGLDPVKVKVNNHLLGGGFGRRLEADFAVQAALVARQAGGPVKVIWSREEDLQHDLYRPFYLDELSAALDANGRAVGFRHRFAGSSVVARYAPAWMAKGIDVDAVELAESPYDFAHKLVEFMPLESPVPTGFWRGVGPTHNTFVIESFIDELAHAAGQDPLAYRQALLAKKPRALQVLTLAAQRAGWGRKLAPGSGMGISLGTGWDSFAASVVECAVDKEGAISLKRITTVIDCSQPVNPNGIVAQMEGGQIYGLTAALYGKLTVENGRVVQSNFHDYPLMRINEVPPIDIHVVRSTEAPGGVGEVGTALVAPALANAVFAATGKRVRSLPLEAEALKRA